MNCRKCSSPANQTSKLKISDKCAGRTRAPKKETDASDDDFVREHPVDGNAGFLHLNDYVSVADGRNH